MKASEIIAKIEQFAPAELQESFDNTGIQIGNPEQEINGILIALDVTENIVDEAIECGYNMIVSHHPLIFAGLKKITGKNYIERVVLKAAKHDIVIYAAHTNLDKCVGGVNYEMADRLGLVNVRVLEPEQSGEKVGLGCVGDLKEPMNETDFLDNLKNTFGARCVRHSALLNRTIRRVALCGGSGSDFIMTAKKAKADIYVTADVTYHKFFTAENEIVIADIGHFECENVTKKIFMEQLSKIFPKFAIRISEKEQNVVNYH